MKFVLTAKQSLLYTDLSFLGNSGVYFKRALKINYVLPECLFRGDDVYWNFDNDKMFNNAFLKNRTLNQAVAHFNSSLKRVTKRLENISRKISKSGKMQSNDKNILLKLFKGYYDAYLLNMPFLFMYWNVENLLITKLKEDYSETILRQLLIPSKETFFSKEKKNMQKIVEYLHKNKEDSISDRLIDEHLRNFAFTTTAFYLGTPMSKKSIWERIKNGLDNYSKEKQAKQQSPKKIDSLRLKLACELMYWKNQRLDVQFRADFLIHPMLETIARLMGYTFQELTYLRYDEIINWFKRDTLPKKREVYKRIKSYALCLKDGKVRLFTTKADFPQVSLEKKSKNIRFTKVIRGTVVCSGKATGRARIILISKDVYRVKKGEILITPMTRPDMVVGMERAAAFVTDQGGMLSHAAIVAREMKKPCIVGTKIATKVFKNGDLIQVNANNGTVKKIN